MTLMSRSVQAMIRSTKSSFCLLRSRRCQVHNTLNRNYEGLSKKCNGRKVTQLSPPQFFIRASSVTMATSSDNNIDPFTKQPYVHATKGNLVYAGPMSKMMKKVKIFSLSTSLVGISSQLYVYLYSTASFKVLVAVGGFLNFFVFVTPICIHLIARNYVTDMFYKKDTRTFTAANVSFLLRRKEFTFTPEDVKQPSISRMFTSHVIKGKSYLIQPEAFMDDSAYVDMMGYDKPLDISIKPVEKKS